MAFQPFTFGETALNAFLQGQKQSQENEQFKMQLAQRDRQESMLNMFRMRDDIRADKKIAMEEAEFKQKQANEYITVQEGDFYNQTYGFTPGKYRATVFDDMIRYKSGEEGRQLRSELEANKMEAKQKQLELSQEKFNLSQDLANANLALKEQKLKQGEGTSYNPNKQMAYNAYMGATYNAEKGGYVVYEGNTEYVFKNSNELKNHAIKKTSDMPGAINAWSRNSAGKVVNDESMFGKSNSKLSNKFEEGKIYIDANGKKAKYSNGQFIEVE